MRISHEAIYQALYVQGRGALRRELVACLRYRPGATRAESPQPRRRQVLRLSRSYDQPSPRRGQRPRRPRPLEGDLILGLASSAIGTLVERNTRFTILMHLPRMEGHGARPRTKHGPALVGHGAEAVRDAIATSIAMLPDQLRRSLTLGSGRGDGSARPTPERHRLSDLLLRSA